MILTILISRVLYIPLILHRINGVNFLLNCINVCNIYHN